MANHRTGPTKGRSGRPGQIAWRHDPLIQERVNLVRTLRAQGYTAAMALAPVNELMRRRGLAEVTLDTVYEDFTRARQLLADERAAAAEVDEKAREQHIEALNEVKRQAWRAFHSTRDTSLNRSAYLNTIRATEETIGKFDGTLSQRVELDQAEPIKVTHQVEASFVANVLAILSCDDPAGGADPDEGRVKLLDSASADS